MRADAVSSIDSASLHRSLRTLFVPIQLIDILDRERFPPPTHRYGAAPCYTARYESTLAAFTHAFIGELRKLYTYDNFMASTLDTPTSARTSFCGL